MADDPIVADVRAQRAQLLEAAGGTLDGLIALLRRREAEAGRSAVTLPTPTGGRPAPVSLTPPRP